MNPAETQAFTQALYQAKSNNQQAAVATVVGVKGSAYRREGARMLILEDASQVCMLSGGCLEAEVVEVALEVIRSGQPIIQHYDLSEDELWGLGIGCGGSVDIRIERVNWQNPLMSTWFSMLDQQKEAVLVMPLDKQTNLQPMLLTADDLQGEFKDPELQAFALTEAKKRLAMREPRAVTLTAPNGQAIFIDISTPPPALILFGAGHDAIPLAAQAKSLGYAVHIVDSRSTFLTPQRFPDAILHHLSPAQLNQLDLPLRSHLVIMNHHLERDRMCLAYGLNSKAEYVGVLGPFSRAQQLLEELEQQGQSFSPQQLTRLRAPIGLKIGAEAPEEVALSILAELMAWRRGYDGRFLNGHTGRIHDAETHAVRE